MTTGQISRHIRHFATDALAGFGIYLVIAAMTVSDSSFAASALLEELEEAAVRVADAGVSSPTFLTLAAVFSLFFALNAAFVRHIRRNYATTRKPAGLGRARFWSRGGRQA